MEAANTNINKNYFDLNNSFAYGSERNIKNDSDEKLSALERKRFLASQRCYTLHFPARKPSATDLVFASTVDEWWHMDLADLRNLKNENNGICYILVAVDVLSKYAFARTLVTKTALSVKSALYDIFKTEKRKPEKIYVDQGLEFNNTLLKEFLTKEGVSIYFSRGVSVHKACVAERWIRTLKTRMWRYFTHNNTHRYVDVLEKIVQGYNNSKHSSIDCAPSSVTPDNFLTVWKRLYKGKFKIKSVSPKMKEGEYVRISKLKNQFAKGYEKNFTEEIFQIKNVLLKNPVMYELIDLPGENISGRFYERELQKVHLPELYLVNKILNHRKHGNRKEYLVSWKGYSDKFNSWVNEKDIIAK